MLLNLGFFEFDAKGLPRVFSLRVSPSYTGEGPVTVSILLDSCRRSAVEKWAARLGVEVVDCKPLQSPVDGRWTYTYEAVRDTEGCRVRVWTSLTEAVKFEDPAAPVCACGCPVGGPCACTANSCPCSPCPVCDRDGGA